MSLSLEQLDTFIRSAESGSFSAAGKLMSKTPSAVSLAISNLEIDLGVELFDRSSGRPILTEQGQALLIDAKSVISRSLELQSKARSLEANIEAEVSLVFDTLVPLEPLYDFFVAFENRFPHTIMNLSIYGSGEIEEKVISGTNALGFGVEIYSRQPESLFVKNVLRVPVSVVVSGEHPLASFERLITLSDLGDYRQLLLKGTANSASCVGDPSQMSPHIWHVGDMKALLIAIRSGVGWGILPWHITEKELRRGGLKKLQLESEATDYLVTLGVFCRKEISEGTVLRWIIDSIYDFWGGH